MFRSRQVLERRSGEIARKRLKLLLVADKTNCSPEFLEMIKDDIFQVVSRYMEIDSKEIEVGLTKAFFHGREDDVPVLYTRIPIGNLSYKGSF